MNILGLACYYHDSSACLVSDGKVIRAAQQERFSRIKHDANFPLEAARYCLDGLNRSIDAVAFYDNPVLKRVRTVEVARTFGPAATNSICSSLSNWWKPDSLSSEVGKLLGWSAGECAEKIHFVEHHLSHAASAFYCSGFESAAVLTLDGVGELATTTIGHARNGRIELLRQINYPHSLGLFYSAFTSYLGFKVNSGEYKVMGLAPLGEPAYRDLLKQHVIELRLDGSFRLNLEYLRFHLEEEMTDATKLSALLGVSSRKASDPLTKQHMDLAASVQAVVEEAFENLARTAIELTSEKQFCLAGGVALNCSAVGKLHQRKLWERAFTQPAAGDAGGSMGAALELAQRRAKVPLARSEKFSVYLGPEISQEQAERHFTQKGWPFHALEPEELIEKVASLLAEGKYVGWCRGRMEWGPRALGARSILAPPLKPGVQKELNLRIKKRESFRPFAPVVLEAPAREIFEDVVPTPHMTCVFFLKEELRSWDAELRTGKATLSAENFRHLKSAVIHKDWSARLQTLTSADNVDAAALLEKYYALTGCPMLVNTSFNVRGEPIVCDHIDAYRCFMRAELDVLVVQNLLLYRAEQPPLEASDMEVFGDD